MGGAAETTLRTKINDSEEKMQEKAFQDCIQDIKAKFIKKQYLENIISKNEI